MEDRFDYVKAVEELEAIAAKVEDPNTGLESLNGSNYYFLKKWDK